MFNLSKVHPIIYCINGLSLTDDEKKFFSKYRPAGVILFKRNIATKKQVISLVEEVIQCTENENIIVCADQEGKSVSRFKPPIWNEYIDNIEIAKVASEKGIEQGQNLSYAKSFLLSLEMKEVKLNVNLSPCTDILYPGVTNKVIANRVFGSDVETIIELSKSCINGMKENGLLSTIKHVPGQGNVKEDSHLKVGINDSSKDQMNDFEFKILKELLPISPFAMVAHVIYKSIDEQNPASMSKKVIDEMRSLSSKNFIIMTDAIEMTDLGIDIPTRSKKALDAGCDLITVCNPDIKTAEEICKSIGKINKSLENQINKIILSSKKNIQPSKEREEDMKKQYYELTK